jgi:hypothetical protein
MSAKPKKPCGKKSGRFFDLLPALSMNRLVAVEAFGDGKALHRNKSNAIFKFIALNRQAHHPMLE